MNEQILKSYEDFLRKLTENDSLSLNTQENKLSITMVTSHGDYSWGIEYDPKSPQLGTVLDDLRQKMESELIKYAAK